MRTTDYIMRLQSRYGRGAEMTNKKEIEWKAQMKY